MATSNQYITDKQAIKFRENWINAVDKNSNLYKYFLYTNSETGNEEPIAGLQVSFQDYLHIVSVIGNTNLHIRFGINDQDQFCYILYTSREYQALNSYFLVQEPIFFSQIQEGNKKPVQFNVNASHGRMPLQAVQHWVADWKVVTGDQDIEVSLFKTPYSSNTDILRGYNYGINESMDILFKPIKASEPDNNNDEISHIIFLFTNHYATSLQENNKLQNSDSTFGVILSANLVPKKSKDNNSRSQQKPNKVLNLTGANYDLGSPCPPTC